MNHEPMLDRLDGRPPLSTVSVQIARIWRGRRLVAVVTLATLVAAVAAVLGAETTYAARAALSAASSAVPEQSRMPSPNEDVALAKMYATYFNTPEFQQDVRATMDLPTDVTSFSAGLEGSDPLLYVVATADSPESARTAAAELAQALVEEVRRLVADERDRRIAAVRAIPGAAGGDPAAASASVVLQEQIDAMNSDSSGLLTLVQPDAGVIEDTPDIGSDLLKALIGGLLLGCAAVVVRAHASRLMTTVQDVRDKTGLPALAVDPNVTAMWTPATDLIDLTGSEHSTVAVMAVSGSSAGPAVAALARRYAQRNVSALVIRADLGGGERTDTRPGVADYLRAREPIGIDDMVVEDTGVRVIGAGTPGGDPFALFDRERFAHLVDQASETADLVIIESPPMEGHPEANIVNGVADRTLLVLEQDHTIADNAIAAVQALDQAGARVRGAILVEVAEPNLRTPPIAVGRMRGPLIAAAVLIAIAALALVVPSAPGGLGILAGVIAGGLGAVYVGLYDPRWAYFLLLAALFLRLALPRVLPVDAFLVAFGGLVLSAAIWMVADRARRPHLGVVELAMALYLLWNIQSALMPHEYAPLLSLVSSDTLSIYRYVLAGTVIPFTAYLLSRVLFDQVSAVRNVLRAILVFSAYSAVVSILEFTGPSSLIWPRYIVDAPNWPGRANGIFNQPAVNGVVMIIGFAIALTLAAEMGTPRWQRWLYAISAACCSAGIYLTHTRAIYLAFVVVIVLGMILARSSRRSFVTTVALLTAGVVLNWSGFTSSDRTSGGIASLNEIYDRMNSAATSIWAFEEKPWAGWGLGRFVAVNSFHHQQWSPETPWIRGLGVSSHFNELGILAELGIIGLVLWLAVLTLLTWKLIVSFRRLRTESIAGRPLVLIAMMAFVALLTLGFFTDLRLFDYPTVMVFGLIGMAVGAGDRVQEYRERDLTAGRAENSDATADSGVYDAPIRGAGSTVSVATIGKR